jgi:hypothetical protein
VTSPWPGRWIAAVVLGLSIASAAQQRVSFEFDAGLPEDPALTQQKLNALMAALPASIHLPPSFDTLWSAPDAVQPPTVRLWFFPEAKAQLLRALSAQSTPMAWPAPTLCTVSALFQRPVSLLAPGAVASCSAHVASVLQQLTAVNLSTCLELEEPERYVHASRAPAGLSQSALVTFVDQRTGTLEQQIALVGAALALLPVPDGLLPPDWVPTMRRVLWKIRAVPTARLATARTALSAAIDTLDLQPSCFDPVAGPAARAQLQAMVNELNAVETHVNRVVSVGVAQAASQQQCLAAKGRTRPNLPFPALTDEEREFVGFWLGGVFWRLRGAGLLPTLGTQNLRTFFARRPFREIARVANGTMVGEKAADAVYCNLFDGWGEWFDMGTGRDPSAPAEARQDAYYDLVQMTNRGRQHVADFPLGPYTSCLVFAPGTTRSPEEYLRNAGYDPIALYGGGLSMGPCYLYGLNPLKNFTYYPTAQAPPPYSGMFEGFTNVGEFCAGGSLALGLTRSLLNGTPSGQPPTNLCGARQCGLDPCGDSCGSCPGGLTCDPSGLCVSGGGGGAGGGGAGGGAGGGGAGGGGAGGGGPGGGGAGGGGAGGGGAGGGGAGGGAADGGAAAGGMEGGRDGGPSQGGELSAAGCSCSTGESFALGFLLLGASFRKRVRFRNTSRNPTPT